jgi:hypothetical protein
MKFKANNIAADKNLTTEEKIEAILADRCEKTRDRRELAKLHEAIELNALQIDGSYGVKLHRSATRSEVIPPDVDVLAKGLETDGAYYWAVVREPSDLMPCQCGALPLHRADSMNSGVL